MFIRVCFRFANLSFLKSDFENLDFLHVFGFFSKSKKSRQNLAFSGFFKVFGFISKIKKAPRNLAFFLIYFRTTLHEIAR